VNHMVVVTEALSRLQPRIVEEVAASADQGA
jgi:hypothetical protein